MAWRVTVPKSTPTIADGIGPRPAVAQRAGDGDGDGGLQQRGDRRVLQRAPAPAPGRAAGGEQQAGGHPGREPEARPRAEQQQRRRRRVEPAHLPLGAAEREGDVEQGREGEDQRQAGDDGGRAAQDPAVSGRQAEQPRDPGQDGGTQRPRRAVSARRARGVRRRTISPSPPLQTDPADLSRLVLAAAPHAGVPSPSL